MFRAAVLLLALPAVAAADPSEAGARGADRYGDPLPAGAVARLGTMRLRHGDDNPRAVAFSPDGAELATRGYGFIHIWDAKSGRERVRFSAVVKTDPDANADPDADAGVTSLAYSPDGRLLVSASHLGPPAVWDARTGAMVRAFTGLKFTPRRGQFSPDGAYLTFDEGIDRHDAHACAVVAATTGAPVSMPAGRAALFPAVAGRYIHSAAETGELTLRRLPGGELGTFDHPDEWVHAFALSGDRKRLVTVGESELRVWDAGTARQLAKLDGDWKDCEKILTDRAGAAVLTWHSGGRIAVWDVATAKRRWEVVFFEGCSAACFTPGGEILTVDWRGRLCAWRGATGEGLREEWLNIKEVDRMTLSPDGKTVVTTAAYCRDARVVLTDVARFKPVMPDRGHDGMVYAAVFRPDGRLAATQGADATVRVWEPRTGRQVRAFYWGWVRTVAFSPDGARLVADNDRGERLTGDLATGKTTTVEGEPRRPAADKDARVAVQALSPDGKLWARRLEGQNEVTLTDAATGGVVHTWENNDNAIDALLFSPDGRTLAAGRLRPGAAGVSLWDVRAGGLRRALREYDGAARPLAFSPDGSLLITAGPAGDALVWDIRGCPAEWRAADAAQLGAWWDALAAPETATAYEAMTALRDAGPAAVALIRDRIAPAPAAAPRPAVLAAALGATDFKMRETAARDLARLGELAVPALRAASVGGADVEVRDRARRLLEWAEAAAPARARAAEVLELIADTTARDLLAAYAAGHPDAQLTRDAAGALKRLAAGR